MSSRRTTSVLAAIALLAVLLTPASVTAQGAQFCDGVAATIIGTEGADVLTGTDRRDVIVALGGDDRIIGGRGNDLICAGRGRDRVSGGAGKDTIFGGTGNDRLSGGSAADNIDGGGGNDRVFGNGGDDMLAGGKGRDRLVADVGADSCVIDTEDPPATGCEQGNWRRFVGSGDSVLSPGLRNSFVVEDECDRTPIRCEYFAAKIEIDGATSLDALGVQAFDEVGELLVNYSDVADTYGGVFLFRGRPASIQVDSGGGSWSVMFVKASALVEGGRSRSGAGNSVYVVDRPVNGVVTATMQWSGFGNFAVLGISPTDLSDRDRLLANEVRFAQNDTPPFLTEKVARSGITLVQVLSDEGSWTVTLSG